MIILSASDIKKSYGTDVILENISFHVNAGDKVGIIGANGAGKTTLLNILSGQLPYDSGNIFVAKETTIGYLKQRDQFDPNRTVMEEVRDIFGELEAMEKEIQELNERIAAAPASGQQAESAALWNRLGTLQDEFARRGGYTYKSEIRGVLTSMAFGEKTLDQKTGSLSGGERTRLALACLLLRKPDILFLDEPTNHLDIGTLKWLEQYLKAYSGTLILISHDRYFLDQVVDHVFEVSNKHLTCYTGNYTAFAEKKRLLRDAQLKAYTKQQTEIRRQEDLIRRYKERGTEKLAKRAASREKRLSHVERLEKPEAERRAMKIGFDQNIQSGSDVLLAEGLAKTFYGKDGPRELFHDVNFDIKRGERICIVGANGVGKTTLLRIITEETEPSAGYLRIGHNVEFGYYDQGQMLLSDDLTVIDEIHETYRLYKEGELRNILGRFLFTGDMVFRQVGSLSGGEKARLSLLKLMMGGANVLVLDEPTNHLDIASKEAFEEALEEYPGTVITVTHDRYFLNRVPDRILELTPEGMTEYLGKYDYYVEKKEALGSGKAYLRQLADGTQEASSARESGGNRRDDAVERAGTGGLSAAAEREQKKKREAEERRRKREIERLEALIAELEEKIKAGEQEMLKPENQADHTALARIGSRIQAEKEELEAVYEEWAALAEA
ncbi:MAG: ABC-F type ribosomal protection protein [Firmicutes bacterium]|nr:ABC-F type ribosomal protection protein [Bacillota bacterium]